MLRILVAIGLLIFVFYGSVPDININPIIPPDEIDEVEELIKVERPSEAILLKVRPAASLISQTEDRAKLALFNHEFANRVSKYNTDVQKLNDVYAKAGSIFFDKALKGKYDGFSESLEEIFESVTTDENHSLTDEEKKELKELFLGLSWALIEG